MKSSKVQTLGAPRTSELFYLRAYNWRAGASQHSCTTGAIFLTDAAAHTVICA